MTHLPLRRGVISAAIAAVVALSGTVVPALATPGSNGPEADTAYADRRPQTTLAGLGGPIEALLGSTDLNCGLVTTAAPAAEQFHRNAACGTFVHVDGDGLYGPHYVPGSTARAPRTAWTPGTIDTRTDGDTRALVTTASGGGLVLTQRDSYRSGEPFYTTSVAVANTTAGARTVTVYRVADCSVDGDSWGAGFRGANGVYGCDAWNAESSNRLTWQPVTGGSSGMADGYAQVWDAVAGGTLLPGRVDTNRNIDNAAGLSWRVTIPAGVTATFTHRTGIGSAALPPVESVPPISPDAPTPTPDPTPTPTPEPTPTPDPDVIDLTIDSDGDGLPDAWEDGTARAADPTQPDLSVYGANPYRRDLFAQVGPTKSGSVVRMPNTAAMRRVAESFRERGINLHIDAGPSSLMDIETGRAWGTLSQMGAPVEIPLDVPTNDFANGRWRGPIGQARAEQVPPERAGVFYYWLYVGTYGGTSSSGLAWTPGDELLFALGPWAAMGRSPSLTEEAGTVMHEFGHNLGLGHGGRGAEYTVNDKPNYVSIMNYLYQMSGLHRDGANGVIDYSEGRLSRLDENALNEAAGLDPDAHASRFRVKWRIGGSITNQSGAADRNIDWNSDGTISSSPFAHALRYSGWSEMPKRTLSDHDDWGNLVFGAGGKIGRTGRGDAVGPGEQGAERHDAPAPELIQEPPVQDLRDRAREVSVPEFRAPRALGVEPGATVPLRLSLSNPHDEARTYELTVTTSGGAEVETPGVITVAPATTQSFTVEASLPLDHAQRAAEAQWSGLATVEIHATAQGEPTDAVRVTTALFTDDTVESGITEASDGSTSPTAETPLDPQTTPYTPPGAPEVTPPASPPGTSTPPSSPPPGTDGPTRSPAPSPDGTPVTDGPTVRVQDLGGRVAGADRFATAAALSAAAFPDGSSTVVVATGATYPDALAGGAAAAAQDAPVLLTTGTQVPASTLAELKRLSPARIVVVGGTSAVSETVTAHLARATDAEVTRLAGPDRFATAARAAEQWADTSTVYLASGLGHADAMSAGTAAAAEKAPLLLSGTHAIPPATRTALSRLDPERIVLVGGTSVLHPDVIRELTALHPAATITRVAGADRYETNAQVLDRLGETAGLLVATGSDFADALTGIPVGARLDAPVALMPTHCVGSDLAARLARLPADAAAVLGGDAAIAPDALRRTCR